MDREQKDVYDFMVKAGQVTPDRPTIPPLDVRLLRVKLIAQELRELAQAYGIQVVMDSDRSEEQIMVAPSELHSMPDDVVEALDPVYDATQDILVVTIGNGVAAGLHLDPGWQEVHDSNMSKFVDGYRGPDGKWQKGPAARKPNLKPLIRAQLLAAQARDNHGSLPLG